MPNGIRMPAVAGILYPRSAHELRREVTRLLQQSSCGRDSTEIPKALIVPHAGLEYSGAVAAAAYARVRHARETIERVVLVGPAHDTCVPGLAVSEVGAFATPLGLVAVHRDSVIELLHLPEVHVSGFAHAREHSLEVQLPFLQVMLAEFTIVPVVVTDADPVTVASALDRTWGGPETLIVVSSDLSHYQSYREAARLDAASTDAILHSQWNVLGPEHACGYSAINGLMYVAAQQGMHVEVLDLRNSGDVNGDFNDVVGYGAFALV